LGFATFLGVPNNQENRPLFPDVFALGERTTPVDLRLLFFEKRFLNM